MHLSTRLALGLLPSLALTALPPLTGLEAGLGGEARADSVPPLQTRKADDRGAWLLQGWSKTVSGTSGQGKTQLAIEGEDDYRFTVVLDGEKRIQRHPALFDLADGDHALTVRVEEPRGGTWEGEIEVPKGMRVTLSVQARYEHRGYLGTIRNDTHECRHRRLRRQLRFDVTQDKAPVMPEILLDPSKSAPGVRLKKGDYEVMVSESVRGEWVELARLPLEVTEAGWRFSYRCSE